MVSWESVNAVHMIPNVQRRNAGITSVSMKTTRTSASRRMNVNIAVGTLSARPTNAGQESVSRTTFRPSKDVGSRASASPVHQTMNAPPRNAGNTSVCLTATNLVRSASRRGIANHAITTMIARATNASVISAYGGAIRKQSEIASRRTSFIIERC